MYDREIVMDSLRKIHIAIETILDRAAVVSDPDELLTSPGGMMRLDAICMNLIALGEAVKGLDKQTHGELLPRYPEVYWSGVMRMRDKIAHHYFEVDTDVVFLTVQQDVPKMKKVIDRMIADIEGIQCVE
jgi:uncharacterized protein with HEPN domain